MKVAGFTFIRNAIQNDYSIVEAITSILPICDEFIVAHGNSNDETLNLIEQIGSPKIKIVQKYKFLFKKNENTKSYKKSNTTIILK